MQQTYKKTTAKKYATAIALSLCFCVLPCCVSPGAVKTDIASIKDNFNQLEKVVDQKADSRIVAEHIEEVRTEITQTAQVAENLSVWKKKIEAQTVNYGGAGWVVVGTGVMALIFVGAGLLLIRAFMKRGTLLNLLTSAIKKIGEYSPGTIGRIKFHLKDEVAKGRFLEQDRENLGLFCKKMGIFSEHKDESEV